MPIINSNLIILIVIKIILDLSVEVNLNKIMNKIKILNLVTQSKKKIIQTKNDYKN
jgi:hypothetical protein